MNQQPKNIPASIHRRLANEAKRMNKPFNEILQYYGMERFLYRLSKTQYADSFVLKGGLILYGWELPLRRPTKDIDFLGILEYRREVIDHAVKTAFAVSVPEDGIYFDPDTISIVATEVDANRAGIHARFVGYLDRTQISIHIDIGFADELSSRARPIDFPTVLRGMPKPQLIGYPIESVVAEKFHAMQRFASIPSRWKDYYDIWLISEHFGLMAKSLQSAIITTFRNRSTEVPTSRPISLSIEFATEHDKAWKTFLQNSGLDNPEINNLTLCVDKIWAFLELPLDPASRKNKRWIPTKREWM